MNTLLRHPVRVARAFVRNLMNPVEATPIPEPGLITFMQKIQFCSMGLMTGFGDSDHCYLPDEVTPGALAVICHRHIEEAYTLGVVESVVA